jgi:Cytochrome bd terminal oxidase subunit I
MNYPVWELTRAGGGLPIALIAILHVCIAHFAVGGGLLLVLTEIKARRLGSAPLLDYTRRHALFFLLLTMVAGSVSGVGIWFTIALLNPTVTSLLIHTFVFAWAAEWVCFAVEIASLLVYYYGFERLGARDHLKAGWLYFAAAWLSLFWINGIIDFMLTPGRWPQTGSFWDGLLNPSMLPALGFRTALALVLAGAFGLATAAWMKGLAEEDRRTLTAYHARWLVFPMIAAALCGIWYFQALSADIQRMIVSRSPELAPYLTALWIGALIVMAAGLLGLVRVGPRGRRALAVAVLMVGVLEMGSFEFLREGARRPFAVYGQIYANAISVSQKDAIDREGILTHARWVSRKAVDTGDPAATGHEIFRLQCLACHSVGGAMNDILPRTRKFSLFGMDAQLNGQGKLLDYMPPFMGTVPERESLARYIVQGLHRRTPSAAGVTLTPRPLAIPPFDAARDKYILLAWSSLGMNHLSDCDALWSLAPPGADLYAQLIARGPNPRIVTDNVVLHYKVTADDAVPSQTDPFWKYAEALYGRSLPADTGLTGTALEGAMHADADQLAFVTKGLPVVPYPQSGGFDPYPLVTVEARDARSGAVLARTRTTVPVSTELGCRNCHGGPWRVDRRAGISHSTAEDVLTVHDRISKTHLRRRAAAGRPVRCQSCHADALRGDPGKPGRLNLSAAVHGFHALYLTARGADACRACHPADPRGATRMLRGIHNEIELDCTNCHGVLEDHALGLLQAESQAGKRQARKLMRLIRPGLDESKGKVAPRRAWFGQPDCLDCHVDFQPPDTDQTTPEQRTSRPQDLFRMRSDDTGIRCAACHGAPHALYPARNPYGAGRDGIAPRQYQQSPYPMGSNKNCKVCHTVDMREEIHHPNMLTEFRNTVTD